MEGASWNQVVQLVAVGCWIPGGEAGAADGSAVAGEAATSTAAVGGSTAASGLEGACCAWGPMGGHSWGVLVEAAENGG